MSRPLSALIALVALAAACGPNDGPRKPVPAGYEGTVQFIRYTQYIPGFPVGEFLFAQGEFFFDEENQWLDAGSRIDLLGPGGDVTLVRVQVPGKVVYQKEPGTDIDPSLFVPGGTYGLDVKGSKLDYGVPGFELADALTLPQAFSLTAPDITGGEVVIAATANSALSLSWIPGDGENVFISFGIVPTGTTTADIFFYTVADDGNLVIPGRDLDAFPSGTGSLTIIRRITNSLAFPEEGTGEARGGDGIQCAVTVE